METAEFWKTWMNALRKTNPALLAYLSYMVIRLAHMRVLLRPTGSLYLHCDPTAAHYIKVMLDGVFGHANFRNEIIWKRTHVHGGADRWGSVHDTLLFYSRSDKCRWTGSTQAYGPDYVGDRYDKQDSRGRYQEIVMTGTGIRGGRSGKPWQGYDPTAAGRHWAVPRAALAALRAEGVQIPDDLHARLDLLLAHGFVYLPPKTSGVPRFKRYLRATDKGFQCRMSSLTLRRSIPRAKERMGYATQKTARVAGTHHPGKYVRGRRGA